MGRLVSDESGYDLNAIHQIEESSSLAPAERFLTSSRLSIAFGISRLRSARYTQKATAKPT